MPGGIGWYRKSFQISPEQLAGNTLLQFDGVYQNSTIYLNGTEIHRNAYGYNTFQVDLSQQLQVGENLLAVRVDDSLTPSSRWYNGAGIYRNVWMFHRNAMFFGPDPHVYTKYLTENSATLALSATHNGGHHCLITLSLGEETLWQQQFEEGKISTEIPVENPKLWSHKEPNLYALKLELFDENTEILDRKVIDVGIRTTEFSSDQGFLLSGTPVKIQGVCQHHDAGSLGSAVPYSIQKERIIQLKEAGVNAIRTGHTPFAPEFYQICDEIGMMVMDETFDGWEKKADYDYGALHFATLGKEDLAQMIKNHRNHPCIIAWGIGNETGSGDIHGLTQICHQLDPTRCVSGGQLLDGVDVIGLNGPSEAPGYLEKLRGERPDSPVMLTEYPHCYSTRGFYRTQTWWRDYSRPRFDVPDYSEAEVFDDYSPRHSNVICYNSSYDNATVRLSHKKAWQRARDFRHIAGMFMWTGHDYLGESFGWPFRSGNYGILDLAGFPKDSYYLYQSLWSGAPMVHLLPHWNHPGKEGKLIPVVAYTNCQSVDLRLNGISLGVQVRGDQMELLWHVPYAPGRLEAVATTQQGVQLSTEKVTPGHCKALTLQTDRPLIADGVDVVGVTVTATDSKGNFCNTADNLLQFHVSGGTFLASENGDPFDLTSPKSSCKPLFYGLNKGYIQSKPGETAKITLCAVLGDSYFKNSTLCTLTVVSQELTTLENAPQTAPEIRYTTDGSCPTEGKIYDSSFVLTQNTTVRAVAVIEGELVFFRQEFVRGSKSQEAEEFALPLSEEVVGCWTSEKDEMVLNPDGRAEFMKEGKKYLEVSWWYETPIDAFESNTGDIHNGEIQYNFDTAKLKMMADGKLRFEKHMQKGIETLFYSLK